MRVVDMQPAFPFARMWSTTYLANKK